MKEKVKIVIGLKENNVLDDIKYNLSKMYIVEFVNDAEEAYHAIHDFKPNIVILDFSLEKIHPIELYEGVSMVHSHIGFVICVTEDNFKVAERVWSKRACDFIFKPFTPSQFINDINKIVRNFFDMQEIDILRKKVALLEKELDSRT